MKIEILGQKPEPVEPTIRLWLEPYGDKKARLMAQVDGEPADYLAVFFPIGAKWCGVSDNCPNLGKWAKG